MLLSGFGGGGALQALIVLHGGGGEEGEGFDGLLQDRVERDDFAGFGVLGVDELEHADDFVLFVEQGQGQEGLGTVAGLLIELAETRKSKPSTS